jgi:hypothetical protein
MWWPSRDASPLIVACVGGLVAAAIASARAGVHAGHLRAVFERSAYIELDGQWFCVGAHDLGRGPLNALVESRERLREWLVTAKPGADVRGAWPRFRIGEAQLDFSRATRWHPAKRALPIDREQLARGVSRMRNAARGRVPGDGLAFLVAGVDSSTGLAAVGRNASNALHGWLVHPDGAPPDGLTALIGLGPGLTPSGDDFLGGALVALHAFGKAGVARALGDWLLPRSAKATHPISIAHLAASAKGEGGEALHATLLALAEDGDVDAALDAIASVGHTSGWDALAGAMTVGAAMTVATAS